MSELSIKAEGLGKQYVIGGAEERYDSFREMLSNALLSPFRKFKRLSGDVSQESRFWALEDINFEISQGDVVGVIGHNGAGKSTLLKVLSRITAPTKGRVEIHGRVASLLEVGTGFHPELTGRENIYLNGSILGMRRSHIDKKFDEIIEFAGVEKFLDTPVKRYSSGMYVRLAFSVAAHLDTDVLLVDEVLAVGDQRFQDRCLGKLGDVSEQGRTILFVSHNMNMVSKLCEKSILLDSGKIQAYDRTSEIVGQYAQAKLSGRSNALKGFIGDLTNKVVIEEIIVNDRVNETDVIIDPLKPLTFDVNLSCKAKLNAVRTTLSIVKDGQVIVSQHDAHKPYEMNEGNYQIKFRFDKKLISPGRYSINLGVADLDINQWLWGVEQLYFQVSEQWDIDYQPGESMGVVNFPDMAERVKR